MSSKEFNLISELARKNEVLHVIEELHFISPIRRVLVTPVFDIPDQQAVVTVTSDAGDFIFNFKSIGVAITIAKVIKADTGAVLDIQ